MTDDRRRHEHFADLRAGVLIVGAKVSAAATALAGGELRIARDPTMIGVPSSLFSGRGPKLSVLIGHATSTLLKLVALI